MHPILTHITTFAKWMHHLRTFPHGNPMARLTLPRLRTGLAIARALTASERRHPLDVAQLAGIVGKTPHAARHAMGRHIMEKTGNVAAVQRQLGHRHAAHAVRYARLTATELAGVINDRR
jgi:integrase